MAGEKNVPVEEPSKQQRYQIFRKEGERTHHTTMLSKIQKTPFLLRDNKNFDKYFKPRAVSLGPIHHDGKKFKQAEKYKLRLAHKFVQESGKQLEKLHGMVEENINELRECFEEEVTEKYNNEDLAWMLFVDGCAILQFIHILSGFNDENQFKKLGIKNHSVAFGQQDLLLLENQVPYRLLEWLMSWSNKGKELQKSIDDFIYMYIKYPQPFVEKKKGKGSTDSPKSQTPQSQTVLDIKDLESILSQSSHLSPNPKNESSHSKPTHLLDLLRKKILESPQSTSNETNSEQVLNSFRNVQELKSAGIHVKPSGSTYLRDISFGKRFNFYPAHIRLPPIIVDDSTGPKFFNLIAYEMCPDFENDYGVISYISFLESLIDHPNDVEELRKEGILYNCLGSDKEVAQLFNEIGTDLVPNPDAYKDVKIQIQRFYNCKWMNRITQAHKEYFRSRTAWAVFGVLLGLALSAAQVRLTAHPPHP